MEAHKTESKREILLGDEAVGLGAIHAGLSGVYGYPGTPSTEIFEFVRQQAAKRGDLHAFWSTNEKVAYEEALGMSWAGKRALVTMKHVGLNVAADAFVNSAVTGVNGGLVLSVADDPGMHSSQNEQDSRHYAQFALIPCFEPKDQQEAYDMMFEAFDLSEEIALPVMLRLVTRLAHSRAAVHTGEVRTQNELKPATDKQRWTLLPSNARVQYKHLVEKQPGIVDLSENSRYNQLELRGKKGIVVCGIADNYVRENLPEDHDYSILSLRQYPVPPKKMKELVDHVDELIVIEDGYPVVESMLRGMFGLESTEVKGRLSGELPRTGELNPDLVRKALGLPAPEKAEVIDFALANRPPALCKGCPHTDTFRALNEALSEYQDAQVFGDIGCYTLSALPPVNGIHTCVAMGASIGMAAGAAHAGYRPAVATIGDSTFAHGGLTALLSVAQQQLPVTVFILDNSTVAMTGAQRSMSTGPTLDKIVAGAGIDPDHVRVFEPLPKHHEENVKLIRDELAHEGPSVIITRRACIEAVKKGV